MSVLNGTDFRLFIGGSVVGHAKSLSISFGSSSIDISNKDTGGWDDNLAGRKNWTASSDALVDVTDSQGFEEAYDAYIAGDTVTITWGMVSGSAIDTSVVNWSGSATIESLDLSANDGEAVSYSIKLNGKGAPTKIAAA